MSTSLNTILIVDDEQSYLDIIANAVRAMNFKVLQALNGKMGCNVALKFVPDIIVMDWEMPEMNGIEAIKFLKNHPITQDIPIIMATGVMTAVENLETALKAGAIDYVRKPIEAVEIVARINSILKLVQSHKEIKQRKEQLEDANREREGLIGIVAHDLRAPLNRVKGLAELISYGENLTSDQKNYLQLINKTCENGFILIRDLLDINQINHQDSDIHPEEINLSEFIRLFLQNYEVQASNKQIKIHLELPETPTTVLIDEYYLTRILDNLITNALKFTYPNTNIFVRLVFSAQHFFISIQDEGQGISQEDQKKMFKRFQKLTAKPTGGENSTGLGLAIVKALVEKLKGEIKVVSEIEKGAEFIVKLPIQFPTHSETNPLT